MNSRVYGTILVLILIGIITIVWQYHERVGQASDEIALTFSDTQELPVEYLAIATRTPEILPKFNPLSVAPPPRNDSPQTKRELAALHELVALRTPSVLSSIEREVQYTGIDLGGITIETILDRNLYPLTSALLRPAYLDLRTFIMRAKLKYDRVRPSYLDPTLTTTIEVPDHPAYPSGHATEAMFFALLLSELDPENRAAYLQSAESIAWHREVAGVHYRSDSVVGQQLAADFVAELQATKWYQEHFVRAQAEW